MTIHMSHGITRYLLFILGTGPDDGLMNLKHVTYASEREYIVCFDW